MGIILDLLEEFGLSAVLRERLEEIEERLARCDAELKECNAKLKRCELEKQKLQKIIDKEDAVHGDPCPYCKRPEGQLQRLIPHPVFGEVGFKIGIYQCAYCSKEYEKEHKP
jgi:hypothetical protein